MIHAAWDDETKTLTEIDDYGSNMNWDDVKRMINDLGGTLSYENFLRYRHLYQSHPPIATPMVVVTVPQEIYDKIEKAI